MDKMNDNDRKVFVRLVKGDDPLKVAIEMGYLYDLAKVHPEVTLWTDKSKIPTIELSETKLLNKVSKEDKEALLILCKEWIDDKLGNATYDKYVVDIQWFFKMLAPDAFKTVVNIMENPKVAPQTRLTGAFGVLDRAGYQPNNATANAGESVNPVRVVINYNKKPVAEGGVINGEVVNAE